MKYLWILLFLVGCGSFEPIEIVAFYIISDSDVIENKEVFVESRYYIEEGYNVKEHGTLPIRLSARLNDELIAKYKIGGVDQIEFYVVNGEDWEIAK